MTANGTIRIRRKANLAAGLRKLDILIDGRKVGNIANNTEQTFALDPGPHTAQVSLWAKSEIINIDLYAGDTIELECGVAPDFWKRTLSLVAIFVAMYFTAQLAKDNPLVCLIVLFIIIVIAIRGTRSNFLLGGTYYLKRLGDETPAV